MHYSQPPSLQTLIKGGRVLVPEMLYPPAFLFINLSGLNKKKVVSTIAQNALLQTSIFISLLGPDESGSPIPQNALLQTSMFISFSSPDKKVGQLLIPKLHSFQPSLLTFKALKRETSRGPQSALLPTFIFINLLGPDKGEYLLIPKIHWMKVWNIVGC